MITKIEPASNVFIGLLTQIRIDPQTADEVNRFLLAVLMLKRRDKAALLLQSFSCKSNAHDCGKTKMKPSEICYAPYSKKPDNLKHAVALLVWHFNFCRVYAALKIKITPTKEAQERTPAQAAGLVNEPLEIKDLFTSTI